MSNIWAQGFNDRLDNNGGKPKCRPGNKPCGKRCIPDNQDCKAEGGAKGGDKGSGLKRALGVGAAIAGAAALGGYLASPTQSKKGGAIFRRQPDGSRTRERNIDLLRDRAFIGSSRTKRQRESLREVMAPKNRK